MAIYSHPAIHEDLQWRVARMCDGGNCIMVARDDDHIIIRSSRKRGGPVTRFTIEEWKQFIAGVKYGDFDDVA